MQHFKAHCDAMIHFDGGVTKQESFSTVLVGFYNPGVGSLLFSIFIHFQRNYCLCLSSLLETISFDGGIAACI